MHIFEGSGAAGRLAREGLVQRCANTRRVLGSSLGGKGRGAAYNALFRPAHGARARPGWVP